MAERPILFNTEMVRAILDDRKTQTRRICKIRVNENEPVLHKHCISVEYPARNYMGVCANFLDKNGHFEGASQQRIFKDDILWVRETWCENNFGLRYKANGPTEYMTPEEKWRPSIHMPREAARLFLLVKDVRIERLQCISEADVKAEGTLPYYCATGYLGESPIRDPKRFDFARIWDSTIKTVDHDRCGWYANPWVWVIEFERIDYKK